MKNAIIVIVVIILIILGFVFLKGDKAEVTTETEVTTEESEVMETGDEAMTDEADEAMTDGAAADSAEVVN